MTARTLPSSTASPSLILISRILPPHGASTGISIFIDSRMMTVSPSLTSAPACFSIFHTVPVMCALTSVATLRVSSYARQVPASIAKRLVAVNLALVAVSVVGASVAAAHPEFAPQTVNRYIKFDLVAPDGVRLAYTVMVGAAPAAAARAQ